MNPLEDVYRGAEADRPSFPFAVPDSIRLLDPTMPLGSTVGFTSIDPSTGQPDYHHQRMYQLRLGVRLALPPPGP